MEILVDERRNRPLRRRRSRRSAKDRPYSLACAHLKLCLRDVDLTAVDELDDELEVVEAYVLRHNDRRVLTGIRQ